MRDAAAVLCVLVVLTTVQAADKPWSKTDGEFAALLEFVDPENPSRDVAMEEEQGPGVFTVRRGGKVFANLNFGGCASTDTGCDVVARFTTMTPQGKPLGEPVETGGAPQKPGGPKIRQINGKYGIILDPGDAVGVFKVTVEVSDRVAKKKVILERDFEVVEAGKPAS